MRFTEECANLAYKIYCEDEEKTEADELLLIRWQNGNIQNIE